MVVGATAPDGATFVAKVTGGPVRVQVADNAAMASPVFTSSQAVDAQGVATVSITGLEPGTRHWWRVEDNGAIDTSVTGQFRTLPPAGQPASFTIAAIGDSGLNPQFPGVAGGELNANLVSNHPVHDTVRSAALAGDWLQVVHLGDWGYPDWGTVLTDTTANRRTFYDNNLAQPLQGSLFRDLPLVSLWDDHDFAGNNSDGSYANKSNAAAVYRERVPHYPLSDASGIWQSWPIGRTLHVGADVRYFRSPNSDPDNSSKTMLGPDQKVWLEHLLTGSPARLLVWWMPQQWLGTAADSWGSFTTERAELIEMVNDHGFHGRMCIVSADYHGVALDDGTAAAGGGIPVLQVGALDATPGAGGGGAYSEGTFPGRNQYGSLSVDDVGSAISVRMTGWRGNSVLVSHQFGFSLQSGVTVSAPGALLRTISGSHRPRIEARLVTGRPVGDDPDGVEIPVVGGDVTLDASAEVRASAVVETPGVDENTGLSTFPRRLVDQLAPFSGLEVFIRYGVDLGGAGTIWTPLGYFRLDRADQRDAPYGPVALRGRDRTAALIRATLLRRRHFGKSRTLGYVAQQLIREIHPEAVIAWDDDAYTDELGRTLAVEESRYEALRDLATSRGKIFYVDDIGIYRFEAAPDETVPLWDIRAGRDGTLAAASRTVSAEQVFNAVIATGQSADDQLPVRAVAIDNNPASPTFFFGDFGQAPTRYESPLIRNQDQGNAAALARLRRSLRAPYEVMVTAACNPTLRPYHPVRITHDDGNREIHVMQQVRIPLSRQPMTGLARHMLLGPTTGGTLL